MVPPVERSAYMYELRNIAENIVRERCEHSEVQPPTRTMHVTKEPVDGEQPVEPVFNIPMTQGSTLEELPSQMDFDWQDSVSDKGTPVVPEAADEATK